MSNTEVIGLAKQAVPPPRQRACSHMPLRVGRSYRFEDGTPYPPARVVALPDEEAS